MTDKRKGWLADLTSGSTVAISGQYGAPPTLAKVDRITPTGRIVVGACEYNSNG